jgi:hypothetical protein
VAEQEEKSASIPWLPLITLIGVGSGVLFLSFQQLTSSRPGGGDPRLAGNIFDSQAIDARLWQDPLGVAMADRDNEQKQSQAHSVKLFQELLINKCFSVSALSPLSREFRFAEEAKRIQVLMVMIPGGPYVEDVERRLRSRRAVIEGLGTAGYAPEQDHEIAYFCVPWLARRPSVTTCVRALEENRHQDESRALNDDSESYLMWSNQKELDANHLLAPYRSKESDPHGLLVPYEWCESEGSNPENPSFPHVLVLWLTDSAFGDAPLARLADFISWFRLKLIGTPGDGVALPLPNFTILGPDNSATLHKMVVEARESRWSDETRRYLATTHIYSSQASAAESQLLAGTSTTCKDLIEPAVKRLDLGNHFHFDRTNIPDDRIVDVLWQELKRRGIKSNDHVAIISEEDTYYARALSSTFMASTKKLISSSNIHSYKYLRGIDGKLPSDEKDKKEPQSPSQGGGKNGQTSLRPSEQTEGLNQADDIRRLAQELSDLDTRWRREGGHASLKAVGLLGSDVYDKLELLKALRPLLPDAVFFTNQLDARLGHPDEWNETHNLVVVSGFPLSINESQHKPQKQLSQNVAPFRDGGQTALYQATLEAIGKIRRETSPTPPPPLIFEIGRNGPKELTAPHGNIFQQIERHLPRVRRVLCAVAFGVCLLGWIWLVSRVTWAPNGRTNQEA